MYKLATNGIVRLSDGACIPLDQNNMDYATYLAWVSQGNTPEPEDVPAPAVPQSVSPRQARKALRLQNLLSTVQAAVDAADDDTKEAWEYSTAFERNSPFVASMAAVLGLTNEELDNLFIEAASL